MCIFSGMAWRSSKIGRAPVVSCLVCFFFHGDGSLVKGGVPGKALADSKVVCSCACCVAGRLLMALTALTSRCADPARSFCTVYADPYTGLLVEIQLW